MQKERMIEMSDGFETVDDYVLAVLRTGQGSDMSENAILGMFPTDGFTREDAEGVFERLEGAGKIHRYAGGSSYIMTPTQPPG